MIKNTIWNFIPRPTHSWFAPGQIQGLLVAGLICASITGALFYNGRHIDLYALSGTAIIFALALTVFCRAGNRLEVGPTGVLLALYVIWNAFAITWSQVPYMSVIELGLTGSGLAMYLTFRLYNTTAPAFPTRFLFIGLGIAFSAGMYFQFATGSRPYAMLLNPNSAAGFLNFIWPIAALAWLRIDRSILIRVSALVAVFLIVAALGLDGSRGAMIGALAGLAVVAGVGLTGFRQGGKTLALIGVFAAGLIAANTIGGGELESGVTAMGAPGLAGASRFTIWDAAWQMIQEKPWLGFGPGVFWLVYPAYRHAADGSAGYFVHNDYLEFWLESGLPGLLLVCALALASVFLLLTTIRRFRADSTGADQLDMATCCVAGLIAVGVHSLFTFNLQMMPFILVTGILLAELERASVAPPLFRVGALTYPRRMLPVISMVALLLIPIGHFGRTAAAFSYIEDGSRHSAREDFTKAANAFSTARAIWGSIDAAWYLHANTLLEAMRASDHTSASQRRELVARATSLLAAAEERNPFRANTHLIRGLLRADHPELTSGSAEDALRAAVRVNPRNIEARYALSQVVARDDRRHEALRIINEGLSINYGNSINPAPLHDQAAALTNEGQSERDRLINNDPIDSATELNQIQ